MKTKGTPGHDRPSAMRHPLLAAAALVLVACAPKGEALYARAEKSLATGEVRAAIIDLKNLVKDEPQNARARALLASALAQHGEMAAAAIEVQKARELGASAETLAVPECRLMIARAEFETALEACKPESATGAAKVDLQVAQGRALLGLERAAEARPQFEAAHAADAGNLDALLGLASATYELEGLPAAKAVMAKASPDIQKKPAYWMAMGGIDAESGDLAAAEADYQKALDMTGKGAEGGERLMALGAIAEMQMRQGKVDDAVKTTDQMIELAPDNPLVKQLRAQVAAAGGKFDEARTLLEEAVAAMPGNTQARTALGVVNLQLGNLGQAEMHFQDVLASEPGNVRAQKLLAETRARLGSPAESLESLKPTLADANADPSLLAMAGRMSLAAGDREQALAYFTQASAKSPDSQSAEVQLEVAGGYLAAGDFDRAVELLEKMPESEKGLQREALLMAALLRKGDTAKALSEASALVDRHPADSQVRNLAAGVYAAAGKKDEARRQLNEALKLKPRDPSSLINLGRLELADGKAAEAGQNFQKALDADPKNLIATVGLATAAAMAGDNAGAEKWLKQARADHPDSIEAVLALSQFYMSTRAFDKAKSVIDEAAQKSPDNAALSNQRGLAMMGLNDVPGAIASFRQATTQAPKAYAFAMNLARAHLANRDLDSALEVLNGVLKSEPKYGPALALAAAASLQAGAIEKAAGYVERLRQAAPDAPATLALDGDVAMAQKRYKDALASYRKASAQGSNTALVLSQYRAASLAGEPNAAKVLEDWVAKNPGDVGAVTAAAELRHAKGDKDGAIALYETALARTPDNVVLLNNLAMLYDAVGNPKAVEYAERAYKSAPQAPAIADTYGWILFKQGKTDQAYDLIREAANKLPDNAEVQYHLAAVLAKMGDQEQAVKLLRKASGSLPANVKPEAQKLLEQLTK